MLKNVKNAEKYRHNKGSQILDLKKILKVIKSY